MKNLALIVAQLVLVTQLFTQALPKHIDLPELGLSFDIPEGWTGQLDGDYLILGHQTVPGLMILFANTSPNAQTLKELAMQGINEPGVQLSPEGEFTLKSDQRVEGYYTGNFNGTNVKCYAIGLINRLGSGMNILILTDKSVFKEHHSAEANKLAASVKFKQAKDAPRTSYWKNKIVGQQLKYMYTRASGDYTGGSTSFTETTTFDICSDGSFYFYSNTQSNIIAGDLDQVYTPYEAGNRYDASKTQGSGTYKIYSLGEESYIEFYFQRGKIVEYDLLEDQEGNTYLDQTRYLVLQSQNCR